MQVPWIDNFNIQYFVGIDGLSAPLVFLTSLLMFLCIIASWDIKKHVFAYFSLFLLLNTGMMGVFLALDFFLFYIFLGGNVTSNVFSVGIWGGPERKYAFAIKFFLYFIWFSFSSAWNDCALLLLWT